MKLPRERQWSANELRNVHEDSWRHRWTTQWDSFCSNQDWARDYTREGWEWHPFIASSTKYDVMRLNQPSKEKKRNMKSDACTCFLSLQDSGHWYSTRMVQENKHPNPYWSNPGGLCARMSKTRTSRNPMGSRNTEVEWKQLEIHRSYPVCSV